MQIVIPWAVKNPPFEELEEPIKFSCPCAHVVNKMVDIVIISMRKSKTVLQALDRWCRLGLEQELKLHSLLIFYYYFSA